MDHLIVSHLLSYWSMLKCFCFSFFQRAIDYLKMDIEFSEWLALHDIMDSGLLPKVEAMQTIYHFLSRLLLMRFMG